MRWMTSSSSFLPSRLRMVLPASGPVADKDIDKRGGFWYSTKVPCANDTRWCGAMAAQLICNQWVAGSTPVTSSKKSYDIPLKSGVCRGAFAFMSPTASPPFRKIMPPGGVRVLRSAHHDAAVVFGGVALSGASRQGRVAAPSVCWPRPQQRLPVSAAGGGRRRCSQRESLWQAGQLPTRRLRRNMA